MFASNICLVHACMYCFWGGLSGHCLMLVLSFASAGMLRLTLAPGISKTSDKEHANTSAYSATNASAFVRSSHVISSPILMLLRIYSTRCDLNGSVCWVKVFSDSLLSSVV